jgi:TonB family protein
MPQGVTKLDRRYAAFALLLTLCAVILCRCGGALTSKENAMYLGDFEDIVDYDTPPILVSAVRPDYPEMAREVGAEGRVVLKVLVLEDGTIGRIQILEMPNPILVDGAITAIRHSIFAPATKDGAPCCATMLIPFIFDKDDTYSRRRRRVESNQSGYVDRIEPVELPERDQPDVSARK